MPNEPPDRLTEFPHDWLGRWHGDLVIANAKGKQVIPMQLHIETTLDTGIYNFTIIYMTQGQEDIRSYLLKTIDKKNGHYQIDEQNSIVLDAYFFNDHLLQSFEVMGNILYSNIYLVKDELHYEISFGSIDSAKDTGGAVQDLDTIPSVRSFPILGAQFAKLTRVETLAR